jgi:MFS family permease
MSAGAALAFVGQLWTASSCFYARLMAILVWGEIGAAVGDIAGPVIGGFFAGIAPGGWRAFFLFDACVGLVTLAAAAVALDGRQGPPALSAGAPPTAKGWTGRSEAATTALQQVAVSLLLVGSEYFFSDFLQQKMDESPLPVALGNLAASIGTIAGAAWAARMGRSLRRVPLAAVFGMLCSLAVLAACLSGKRAFLAALPLFVSGVFMGLACVSLYASIVNASTPDGFLRCTLVYLLGMQIGNALGVQAVGIAELYGFGPVATAATLAALPTAIALFVLLSPMERRRFWDALQPQECLFDLWSVRECFARRFGSEPHFLVAERDGRAVGLLALSRTPNADGFLQYPGETWRGGALARTEQNSGRESVGRGGASCARAGGDAPAVPRGGDTAVRTAPARRDGLRVLPGTIRLRRRRRPLDALGADAQADRRRGRTARSRGRGLPPRLPRGPRRAVRDEPSVVRRRLVLPRPALSGELRGSRRDAQCERNASPDGRPRGGRVAAVDIGGVYRNGYTLLAGGTAPEFPGVAKLMNLHHIRRTCAERLRFADFLSGGLRMEGTLPAYETAAVPHRPPDASRGRDL